ncbi:class I SAM-dependent methyltransferase [Saccharomonospora xinjiangensis]|uniref:class I SAM-dependent methyltransferase n=1 Tax=Saccharomonospora xinjiangensis TaxID=75294 RepID=UPI00106FA60B|nr:class I SAM-dependent methyltransferase [Saccharomonospora xinjiangensis]QBQ59205.1 Ubiquinone biosynthesis O-methyltransferase [Saccharomonospora xinjiangensis]
MSAGTHDDIDWAARLSELRRLDALESDAVRAVAERLAGGLPEDAVVVDAGCGAGGMSAALASVLKDNGGGRLVLIDASEELLVAAQEAAETTGGGDVAVTTVVADVAVDPLASLVQQADLVWASAMVHHLPDQQAGVTALVRLLAPGGRLALAEGGTGQSFLPWDIGLGHPGLESRLNAARNAWFADMRGGIDGAVAMPYGWTTALIRAGLVEATSFSYLVEHPPPVDDAVRRYVVERFTWLADVVSDRLAPADRETVAELLDPDSAYYVGARDDVFMLYARTVHTAVRPLREGHR